MNQLEEPSIIQLGIQLSQKGPMSIKRTNLRRRPIEMKTEKIHKYDSWLFTQTVL